MARECQFNISIIDTFAIFLCKTYFLFFKIGRHFAEHIPCISSKRNRRRVISFKTKREKYIALIKKKERKERVSGPKT